jgi:hypothetical protein
MMPYLNETMDMFMFLYNHYLKNKRFCNLACNLISKLHQALTTLGILTM